MGLCNICNGNAVSIICIGSAVLLAVGAAARVCVDEGGGTNGISAQVMMTESGADAQCIFASTTKDAMPRREAGSVVA